MLIDQVTKLPTLGNKRTKRRSVKEDKPSYSKIFADNLTIIAKHVDVLDVERGKKLVLETAEFCLEENPGFLVRVRSNLKSITTKLELQKYVYNSILRGDKLYIRRKF